MKATIYARFSSDNQRTESIDAQIRAIKEYAKREGYTIVKEYVDEARSAMSDNRPAFLRMIADSANRGFEAIIVHKLDRFARNRYDSAYYKRILRNNGVRLISVLENINESPESIIMESVLEGMAEYYSANLAREVMKGMKESAYQCKFLGGKILYGYKVIDGKYAIDENEAPTVRKIFTMFAGGATYSQIIAELDKKHMTNRRGDSFKATALHEMLRNERYTGVYIFNQGVKGKPRQLKEQEQIISVPGGMPAIIGQDIWARCVTRREENARRRQQRDGSPAALLTGLLYCSRCDHKMHVTTIRSQRGYVNSYYRCGNKECDMPKLLVSRADNAVAELLMERVYSVDGARELAKQTHDIMQKIKREAAAEAPRIANDINKLNKKIDSLLNALERGLDVDSIVGRLRDLEAQKAILEGAQRDAEGMPVALSADEIYRRIRKNSAQMKQNPDNQRMAIRACVERIDVAPNTDKQFVLRVKLFSFMLVAANRYHRKAKIVLETTV